MQFRLYILQRKRIFSRACFFADRLTVKRQIFSVIPSTNILDIYRKKEGEGRGKVIAEKYFTFNSIMNI